MASAEAFSFARHRDSIARKAEHLRTHRDDDDGLLDRVIAAADKIVAADPEISRAMLRFQLKKALKEDPGNPLIIIGIIQILLTIWRIWRENNGLAEPPPVS